MAILDKILIANRGEIALRTIRSAKMLGIKTVAIYTESEKGSVYVRLADEAVSLGSDDLNSTFLNIEKIISIAISTGSKAIHPGYGFLSEHPDFAKSCEEHQLIFIGPNSDILRLMANKQEAKLLATSLGIPVVASHKVDLASPLISGEFEFPLLIKASYGGGGKGMELVHSPDDLIRQLEISSRIAQNYFGNGELFVEQYIRNTRHVEVQIIGDNFNNIIHLYERECSIQRNHQKIIEEAPAISLTPELRQNLLDAALRIGKAVNYSGAGTVEFLVDESGNFFFMEMNPRIQVEHAVTEQVTGIDIVAEQLKIASGFPLSISQEEVIVRGHAIELRVYSENPAKKFAPSSIPLLFINLTEHADLRIEADLHEKPRGNSQFDPLLLKLIGRGKNRIETIHLLQLHLSDLNIIGPETNTKYLEAILGHSDYQKNNISVEFCRNNHNKLIDSYINKSDSTTINYLISFALYMGYWGDDQIKTTDPWKHLGYWRLSSQTIELIIDTEIYNVQTDLRNRSYPVFVLNGETTHFTINDVSIKSVDVCIGNISKKISYIQDHQNTISLSLENIQHKITIPGLLSSHPEMTAGSEVHSTFKSGDIYSPLHGTILDINIQENQLIKKGDLLMVIEAMKSENRILSPHDAKVKKIAVTVGEQVTDQMPLIFLEDLK